MYLNKNPILFTLVRLRKTGIIFILIFNKEKCTLSRNGNIYLEAEMKNKL